MIVRTIPDTEHARTYSFLTDLIPIGMKNAVSMKDLSRIMGLHEQELRAYILNARKAGILICSGDQGYYFPEDLKELRNYVRRRQKYIKTASVALRPFCTIFDSAEDQNDE